MDAAVRKMKESYLDKDPKYYIFPFYKVKTMYATVRKMKESYSDKDPKYYIIPFCKAKTMDAAVRKMRNHIQIRTLNITFSHFIKLKRWTLQ